MKDSYREALRSALTNRHLDDHIARINKFGKDEYPTGTVVIWNKQFTFNGTPNTYTYAAVKGDRGWHTTKDGVIDWIDMIMEITAEPVATDWQVVYQR